MSDERDMLSDSVRRLLQDQAPADEVRRAENEGWLPELWRMVADNGLPWIALDEVSGGAGGSIQDLHAVLWQVGRNAAPVPLAETALGAWALAEAGLQVPEGPLTVVAEAGGRPVRCESSGGGWRLTGTVDRVPWAARAERIVMLVEGEGNALVLSVPGDAVARGGQRNLAGEPRETVTFDGCVIGDGSWAPAPDTVSGDRLLLLGALSRVTLMAGAMQRITEISSRYAGERQQFGRPISRFQAVQHHLVAVAAESNRTAMAANSALLAVAENCPGHEFDVAAAKVVAGSATKVVTARSHQLHGAIGMTAEYDLQLFTRRLNAWRDEFGSTRYWSRRLSDVVAGAGPDQLWPLITRSIA